MALKPKVIDDRKLYLMSCLTRAFGYKLKLILGGEFGYELSVWGSKKIGLAEELLAGGQGYDIAEAIENCFLDCANCDNLRGCNHRWVRYENEMDLDLNLALMGHHPEYEPVHMKCIDINKWEVGPEDGKPIVLAVLPGGKGKGMPQQVGTSILDVLEQARNGLAVRE